jgi:putative isomerase
MLKHLLLTAFCCVVFLEARAQAFDDAYRRLNEQLAKGWNTWSYNSMLSHTLLPSGLTLKVNLRNAYIGTPGDPNYCLEQAVVDKSGLIRPIAHSFDGSYTELYVDNWLGNRIRVQSATSGADVFILVTPEIASPTRFFIELETGFLWNQPGHTARQGDHIVAQSGKKRWQIRSTRPSEPIRQPYLSAFQVFKGDTAIGFYTGTPRSLATVKQIIEQAKKNHHDYAQKFGEHAEAFKGIQSVLGWNTLYDVEKKRVITPVTRGWNEAWQGYVLFEWDTYFAALLFGLDHKNLAYANALAVTKGLNRFGAVPFTQMPRGVADQSQPPVGSVVCWKLYEKYRDKWFLEAVYQELLSWNRWWMRSRNNQGFLTWGANWHSATPANAALESGLDNAPMYEDVQMQIVGDNALFNLADVGLNSLYVADCQYLGKIATALGHSADVEELKRRADEYRDKVNQLWSAEHGLFLNRFLDRSENSLRLSPTLFYPWLAGIPSEAQSKRMLAEHYFNPQEFYGPQILPSCALNDKSYNNNYWRGSVWGPMNLLVYLGLKQYDSAAAAELAQRSYKLYLDAWEQHHFVFENTNSQTGARDSRDQLNCDPYYHWGALMGLMQFMEDGHY